MQCDPLLLLLLFSEKKEGVSVCLREKKVRDTVYVLCGERNFFVAVIFFLREVGKKNRRKKGMFEYFAVPEQLLVLVCGLRKEFF